MRASVRRMACAVVVLLTAAGTGAGAHEIGTTRVVTRFPADGTYRIDVVTDATALLARLEVADGMPRSGSTDPNVIRELVGRHESTLRQKLTIVFDGVRVEPAIAVTVVPASEVNGVPGATLALTGRRPAKARTFTWSYALTGAAYGLSVMPGDDGAALTQWLDGDQQSTPVPIATAVPAPGRLRLAARYTALGFTHILPGGLDHVLFVLGIFLLSRRLRPILLQVSAFTIAHSITLGLGMYGLISLPSSIVEPLIALSIAFVAIENIVVREVRPSRIALVFAFGLLHGLGFAGALKDLGLPRSEFLTALLAFNVGVELGQLTVIAAAWALVGYAFGERVWYRRRIVIPASVGIACLGLVWTLQRLHLV